MRVAWPIGDGPLSGNFLGYTRAARAMRDHLEKAGAAIDPKAELALVFTSAARFKRQDYPQPRVVLLTMFESDWIAPWHVAPMRAADAIIVPCDWNAKTVARYVTCPIEVVPLGCHTDFFVGVDREWPKDRPFSFLWIGADNPRKGWQQVMEAWKAGGFQGDPRYRLYLKTTIDPVWGDKSIPPGVRQGENVIVDTRLVTDQDLLRLYIEADCLVWPSLADGWGLPALEALATALPTILILHGGVTAFATPEVVRSVETERVLLAMRHEDPTWPPHYEPHLQATIPSLVREMRWVVNHWVKARKMGVRGWQRAQDFSWTLAGEKLLTAIERIDAQLRTQVRGPAEPR